MRFNINENVKVRLSDSGRKIHREQHDELNRVIKSRGGGGFDYRPPREDGDGWSTWQMWTLMQTFGPSMVGFDPPFHPEIEVPPQS